MFPSKTIPCLNCGGKGYIVVGIQPYPKTCPVCHGTGSQTVRP